MFPVKAALVHVVVAVVQMPGGELVPPPFTVGVQRNMLPLLYGKYPISVSY